MSWIEHVEGAGRERFERRLGAPILRLGADGRFKRQDLRPDYDVLTRVASRVPPRSTIGLDVGGIAARAGTLRAAEAANAARSTPIARFAGDRKC